MTRTFAPSHLLVLIAIQAAACCFAAEPANAPAAAATKPAMDQHTLDKRSAPVLKALALEDKTKEAAVRSALDQYFTALQVWHKEHDAETSPLWSAWSNARSKDKDEAKAEELGKKIDAIYASFRPERDSFLAALAKELAPEQVEAVKNILTRSPGLERTYKAYLEMAPEGLSDTEKAFLHEKLTIARDQSLDTTADKAGDKEKANFFKRQKVVIEAYLIAHGHDYKAGRKAFVEKQAATSKTDTASEKK